MKIHQHPDLRSKGYPVGEYIQDWLPIIPYYVDIIKTYVKPTYNIDIVVTGSSGAIIGALIASNMKEYTKLKVVHIKKTGEDSHSQSKIRNIKHIFFVDDFISAGETLHRINDKIKNEYNVIVCGRVDMLQTLDYPKINNFHCQKWELN